MHDTETRDVARRAGILLHPTSLPGPGAAGTLGRDARWFIDFLRSARQTTWQVLPLSPPDAGHSPYASRSAFAGGAHLLDATVELEPPSPEAYDAFREASAAWLDDWALFEALRRRLKFFPWWEWPAELAQRDERALAAARADLHDAVERERDVQWQFWRQWQALHGYARERGVELLGDIPIFVAQDSADVWAHQRLFKLEAGGRPAVVSGVPPDLFSATGQRWGNPLYDWQAMADDGFGWWIERMRWSLRLFESVRIDHFRGFAAAWEIPASSPTAVEGEWVAGPGMRLFDAMAAALGPLPMIAEDLGVITPDVTALRQALGLPGMAVLQFAFGGGADNLYLPHNISHDSVVYTGTHDNDTTAGWLATLDEPTRAHLRRYLDREPSVHELVRTAYASVARTAIVPFQDVLGLGAEARMNTPGTVEANWQWRFAWEQVTEEQAAWLRGLVDTYDRTGPA